MSDETLNALIAAVTAIVVLINTALLAWQARQVNQVKHLANSMKDELVESTRKGAYARGHLAGTKDVPAPPSAPTGP